jgi:hypothetical protein
VTLRVLTMRIESGHADMAIVPETRVRFSEPGRQQKTRPGRNNTSYFETVVEVPLTFNFNLSLSAGVFPVI